MQADRAAAEAYGADALISALRKVLTTCMGLQSHFIHRDTRYSFSCIVRVVPLRYIAASNPNSALADARHGYRARSRRRRRARQPTCEPAAPPRA